MACQSTDTSSSSISNIELNPSAAIPDELSTTAERIVATNDIMTYAGYSVRIEENGNDLSVNVTTPDNKKMETSTIRVGSQVRQMELMDMNADERPELVVISADENGDEQLAVKSLTPNSMLPVYLDTRTLNAQLNSNNYEIRDGRIYHIYNNQKGEQKRSSYNLVAGEAGFRLEPHGVSLEELNTKVYGEYVSDPYPNTYRQQLTIRDNGLGEIVVQFQSTMGNDEQEVCQLEGMGRLVNGEIQVPLSYFERSLSGNLTLRATSVGWEVMTPSPKVQTTVSQLCSDGMGILGKYKRMMK